MLSVLSGNVHWNVVICCWCSPITIDTIAISRCQKYTNLHVMLSLLIVLSYDHNNYHQ
jgi:hypothetical protein